MEKKKKRLPVEKDWQNRWMYDEISIMEVFNKMSPERKVEILEKALDIAVTKRCSKDYCIAYALGCRYEDAGYYSIEKRIRPQSKTKKV